MLWTHPPRGVRRISASLLRIWMNSMCTCHRESKKLPQTVISPKPQQTLQKKKQSSLCRLHVKNFLEFEVCYLHYSLQSTTRAHLCGTKDFRNGPGSSPIQSSIRPPLQLSRAKQNKNIHYLPLGADQETEMVQHSKSVQSRLYAWHSSDYEIAHRWFKGVVGV
ncbi:hypothetical protein K504DRAFT_184988 [Pleomassaria siparia CBS 279.74]|uniref:Uncharacterized protein n=1 Tax=Pleomassaria siparia CBS 279.74 TaxID=1314801 RepID=A0A6G1JRB1_9PLEO|nr:hypothetical protein K504DRAFT_184988 [Pleomassaria siparia CBS 279.74]